MAGDRDRLRATFDVAAELYQRARPEYPGRLYDTLVLETGIKAGDRLLEVGCATGKATLPLARLGFRITCVELGSRLAEAARRNLSEFPGVEIIEGAFETSPPPSDGGFDLVFAATAWHWIDPATRYQRAGELLRPGRHLALWSATHLIPDGGDPFFAQIQEVYEEIGEEEPGGWAPIRPGQLPDGRAEIEASGLFEVVAVHHLDWEVGYNAEEYLALLDTFSNHIAMEAWKRDRLHAEIRRRLARRSDGRLRRHWGAVLRVASRTGRSRPPGS